MIEKTQKNTQNWFFHIDQNRQLIILIKMFKLPVSKFLLALIKPNKPKGNTDLTLRDLKTCREIFGLPECLKVNIEQASSSYMRERTKNDTKFDADVIYKSWQLSKPLQIEISVLSFSKQMNEAESTYLSKLVKDWSHFLVTQGMNIGKATPQQIQCYRKVLIQFFEVFNSICYLLDMDYDNIQLYLRIYELARSHKIEDKNYSHLRYVLDHLLQQKKIQKKDLQFMLAFTSKFPMQSIYYQKQKDIFNLIYRSLPKFESQRKQHYKLFVNLLHNISIQNEISSSMKTLAVNIYHNFSNSYVRFKAFSTLIDLFYINKHNITQTLHLNNLKSFIKEFPKIAFKQMPKYFYRADIWIESFWIPYFQYVSTGDNYKEIQIFHHFVIDDLLTQDKLGGSKLEREALTFRQFLYKKRIDIRKFDMRKQYEKSFGRIKENKSSCQLQVANSMRLICSSQILTEFPIKYFIVDVLIDKKVVVEINNNYHYKTIDGVTSLNLKSQFRERILQRSGYRCYNIRVDDLSVSNYNMLEDIQKIVESSNIIRHK